MTKATFLVQIFVLHCCAYAVSYAQNVPAIACPNYFQYFSEGNQNIARITIPNVRFGTWKIDVRLSQRSPLRNHYYGKVSLYESYNTTISRIEHGQPIYYRVTFPTPNEFPKLTLLAINGQALCQDHPYPPPSTNIALDHTLTATITTYVKPSIQNRFSNPASNTQPQTPLATQQHTFSSPTQVKNFLAATSTQQRVQNQPIQLPTNANLNCGQEGVSRTLTPFIYGGKQLVRGQFPWLTAIYLKRAEGLLYICVGSLVSTRSIITAAHCFEKTGLKANQILVILGHHDLNSFTEEGDIKLELQALHMHPEYNTKIRVDADIAILHLKSPVRFTNYIQPVCLWLESDDVNLIAGHKASIAGWGEDEQQHAVSSIPKVVEVNIASDSECQEAIRSSNSGFKTRARSICVSNENGEGPCRGDSGSGLIMKRNNRWTLRGVVSSGLTRGKRCSFSEFVYFSDLAKHSSWLRVNII